MSELVDYKITVYRVVLIGTWTWRVTTPDDRTLVPFGFGLASKAGAEADALRRIEIDRSTESLTGEELAQRVNDRRGAADDGRISVSSEGDRP